ncbi:MAG: hypothetical protein JJ833_003655 [Prochlorococcus marinus XMU1424]|uniref:Uncharacterized protein n=1 Tax=Prochlorococcus marinus XMU1424 TaxID=2774497 RepID=A0A9D9BXT0_PROMR|nr:hypothetical protein [Prochlorococcus marinus XMU1424]
MKLVLNFSMFLLAFFSFSNESFALTDYQIKRFCAKNKRVSLCIKNLQEKRSDLQTGKPIKIPVTPFKR